MNRKKRLSKQDKVHPILQDKAQDLAERTGLPRTKAYNIFGKAMPRIIDQKITPIRNSKKKRVRITWVEDYEMD